MQTVQRCLVIVLIVMFAFEAFAGPSVRVGIRYRAPDPAERAEELIQEPSTAPRDVAEVPKVIEVEPLATVQEMERVSRHDEVSRFGTGIAGPSPTFFDEGGDLRIETLE